MKLRLYHYWRSSSSWRVRWALALKGVHAEMTAVDLLNGEVESSAHRERNPLGYVPVLELLDEKDPTRKYLTESLAILEFLEEKYPKPALLPSDAVARAKVRALAEVINSGTQPLQNLTALIYSAPESDPEFAAKRKAIATHWIRNGFEAYEKLVSATAGKFSFGDEITFADLCLIPQCYNALRFEVPLEDYPIIHRIYKNAVTSEGYSLSEPDRYKPL